MYATYHSFGILLTVDILEKEFDISTKQFHSTAKQIHLTADIGVSDTREGVKTTRPNLFISTNQIPC